jgi:flagellar motor switch/type III secretory pathway protein FliN
MKSIMNEKGVLSVELGGSWLTREEAVSLKVGDVVKLNSYAGDWLTIYFNGSFLGTGEMVVLDNNWGFRINGVTEPSKRQIPRIPRAISERIEVCVRMGYLSVSLSELEELKVGSVINLDKPFSSVNGELLVSGIPAAEGEVATLYDNYGLRITKTIHEPQEKRGALSGNLVELGFETDFFRIYNFKRPDMFNRLAINRIRDIHRNLLITLKNRNPQWVEWSLLSLDEEDFSESFSCYQRDDCFFMSAIDKTYGIDGIDMAENLLQPEEPLHPLSERVFNKERESLVERLNREGNLIFIGMVGVEKQLNPSLINQITASWRHLTDLSFESTGDGKVFSQWEENLKGRFGIKIHLGPDKDKSEGLYILYPFLTLSPVTPILSF